MPVLVTGTLGYDYIMDFPGRFAERIMPNKIHKISLSFLVNKLNKQFGGTAGNIAYTLRLLGVTPIILAPAGKDFALYKSFLQKNKISISSIAVYKNVGMGSYFVVTDRDDNQIGSFFIGANKYAKNLSLEKNITNVSLAVVAPTEPEAMKKYVTECRRFGLPYVYDPAFQIGSFSQEELMAGISGAKILIGNDYEIDLITDKMKITHEELRAMVPIVVTTLGNKGSIIETRQEAIHIRPARPKNVSDPTGAGDAYRAGFLAGYLRLTGSDPVRELTSDQLTICGQMGSVAAVYTVEKYGTVTHHFTKSEFIKRYKVNFGKDLKL